MADYDSATTPLEVDLNRWDLDSGFGDSGSIRTASITSSAYRYNFEGGRRYHAYDEGHYILPNDEAEQARLDLEHHLFMLTLDDRLYLAPIPADVHNVLDIGTGTGMWAMDFADQHPSARVLGVDLSPIQPTSVPPNCSFRIDNIESDWIPGEQFDYIHSRAMIAGIRDWPRLLEQCYEHLKPGGYIELQDFNFPVECALPEMRSQSSLVRFGELCIEAAAKIGMNLQAPLTFPDMLRNAGFVDIRHKWYHWPLGVWARGKKNKEMGVYALENFLTGVSAANALFTRGLGWELQDFEAFTADVREELSKQEIPLYLPLLFCYARKPPLTVDE